MPEQGEPLRLLIVEDESRLAQRIKSHLEREGHAVDVAGSGTEALELANRAAYDCVLLDLGLPGPLDGMDVCRSLRENASPAPILILTARDTLSSRIEGLDAGADDYLIKPFALEELSARIRALLRRPRRSDPVILSLGDLRLDTARHVAESAGHDIKLTAREYAMLELFMRNVGRVLDRAEISRHVWDDNYDPASNIIDVYVNRLRAKLDRPGSPKLIHTLRGQGYVCQIEADEP
jgi:DNA-binding response OmpR family regulator